MKKIINLLALDVDGVLNDRTTQDTLNSIPEDIPMSEQIEQGMTKGIKIMTYKDVEQCIGHVDLSKLTMLSKVCKHNNVKVLGISSWFSPYRSSSHSEEFKEFFGLDFIKFGFAGDGQSRLHQVAEFIRETYDLREYEVNLVYMDDDCRFDSTFRYGYESLNLEAFKFLTSKCNTLFLFPYAYEGISKDKIELAGQFWSRNDARSNLAYGDCISIEENKNV